MTPDAPQTDFDSVENKRILSDQHVQWTSYRWIAMATRVASCNDGLAKREFSWVNKELGGLSGYAAGGRINKEECSAFQGGIVNNTFFIYEYH